MSLSHLSTVGPGTYQIGADSIFNVGLTTFTPNTPSSNLFSGAYTHVISDSPNPLNSSGSSFNTNFTTGTISVALNTSYTLYYDAGLIFSSGGNAAGSMHASMNLLSMPFNLPTGFTVNSADAGIVNNAFVSAVPVPAAAWLFGSGLLGLVGVVRRKRLTP